MERKGKVVEGVVGGANGRKRPRGAGFGQRVLLAATIIF
jgi:hypothetical protein